MVFPNQLIQLRHSSGKEKPNAHFYQCHETFISTGMSNSSLSETEFSPFSLGSPFPLAGHLRVSLLGAEGFQGSPASSCEQEQKWSHGTLMWPQPVSDVERLLPDRGLYQTEQPAAAGSILLEELVHTSGLLHTRT